MGDRRLSIVVTVWPVARFALDYTTQHDLHRHGLAVLRPYACVACVGHDEYWTWAMRDGVDACAMTIVPCPISYAEW